MPDPVTTSTAAAASTPPPAEFGVFISYSHLDKDWVNAELLPRLTTAGINYCQDAQHFGGGSSSVANMERGVESSKRTLAVLTPRWVDSEWSQLETLMTIAHDPIGRRRRLVPLLLEPCTPSPAIRILTYRDFTAKARQDAEWELLLKDLRGDTSTPTATDPATAEKQASSLFNKGIQALVEALKKNPEVRDEVVKYRAYFELVLRMVERLSFWKGLHDQLHNLERLCLQPLSKCTARFPDDSTLIEVEVTQKNVKFWLEQLQETLDQDPAHKGPIAWHNALLKPAEVKLAEAVSLGRTQHNAGASGALRLALHKLQRVLVTELPSIDARMQSQAEAVPVKELLRALATLCDQLKTSGVEPSKVLRFQQGAEALFNLCQRLYWLRNDHHLWQEIDRELRYLEGEESDLVREVSEGWEYLSALLAPLQVSTGGSAVASVLEEIGKLSAAIDAQKETEISLRFLTLRAQATNLFYVADKRMLMLCGELSKIGEPLAVLLEALSED